MPVPARRRLWLFVPPILLAGFLGCLNGRAAPLRNDPLAPSRHAEVVDEQLELARRYAPWVFAEFHPRLGRQDVPAPVDFDGNLAGDDNWAAMADFELLPTLYYAVLETRSHWFLAYHVFHPRDWTRFDLGVHLTHENDGENLQVVVEKASGRVVLLFTQAHYRGGAYADPPGPESPGTESPGTESPGTQQTDAGAAEAGFRDGEVRLRGPFQRLGEDGVPATDGRHAAVFVEQGGHGIYGTLDASSRVTIGPDGAVAFERAGWVLRPARPGELVAEPPLVDGVVAPYRLESTTAKLWPPLRGGELTGEGRLLDGTVGFVSGRGEHPVPRYYEADRFSGPLGPDRGIAPFALDFRFGAGEVGALFFAPAERYAELLEVPAGWSLEYLEYPFSSP